MFTFRIPDMTCGHCASTITRAVASVDGSARLEVNLPDKTVSVTSTAAEAELMEAITKAGYTPERLQAGQGSPAAAPRRGCCCG